MKQGGAISVGTGAVVEKGLGTAIGSYATTQGISGVAIGTGALSSGNTALAVGRQSAATATFHKLLAIFAATGKGSLAIGHSATAEGYRSIAIGSPDIENADPVAGQAGAAYQPKWLLKQPVKTRLHLVEVRLLLKKTLAIGAFSESKGKNLLQLVPVQRHKKIMQLLLGTKQKLVSKAA